MSKKILITVGGTGGHVFPAVGLAQQIHRTLPQVDILFAGGELDQNPYFPKSNFPWKALPSSSLSKGSIWEKCQGFLEISRGVARALRLLRDYRPDVVVGFGSYHSLPILTAAKILRYPLVLHEANCYPGKVNRRFSSYAKVTGVQFAPAIPHLSGRAVEVGCPMREGFTRTLESKEEAREVFGLDPFRTTLLCFGGSQGAVALNALFTSAVTSHLAERTQAFQVIHLTGQSGMVEDIRELYALAGISHYVTDFEERMNHVWSASDLAVTRAGAGTLAELLEFEVPALLIPYPYASDAHQERNADFIVNQVKGGVKCLEQEIEPQGLADQVMRLFRRDQEKLKELLQGIRNYKAKLKRRDLCSLVCEVAGIKVR